MVMVLIMVVNGNGIVDDDVDGLCLFQVVVERYAKETTLPVLDKTKFLVPQELTMSQFVTILR